VSTNAAITGARGCRTARGEIWETAMSISSEYFAIERAGDVLIVVLGPRVSSFSEGLLEERGKLINEIRTKAPSALVVDFDKVEYFDSLLLDTLCQVWRHVRERDGKMALCNLCSVAQEIVSKCRLDALWPIYASRQSAVDAVVSSAREK
jgi:anti-sigma B factor antagonist